MPARFSRRFLLSAAVGAALAVAVPSARASSLARVDVYDLTAGRALQTYEHRGRSYVAGEPGHEYAVRIRNCSGRRLLAVVSVDGVNVITGETASPSQSGYVIDPGGYVNVDGWRKSLDAAAAFYFTDPSDAYAARTGRPEDLGVIGVALFPEAAPVAQGLIEDDARSAKSARAAEGAASAPAPTLGTGHGRRVDSPAHYVEFVRASDRPDEIVRIRYERSDRLAAMGVLPSPWTRRPPREPDPFPATVGFVPDP